MFYCPVIAQTYTYLTLLLCTAVLLYFYSYPLGTSVRKMRMTSTRGWNSREIFGGVASGNSDVELSEKSATHHPHLPDVIKDGLVSTVESHGTPPQSDRIPSSTSATDKSYLKPSVDDERQHPSEEVYPAEESQSIGSITPKTDEGSLKSKGNNDMIIEVKPPPEVLLERTKPVTQSETTPETDLKRKNDPTDKTEEKLADASANKAVSNDITNPFFESDDDFNETFGPYPAADSEEEGTNVTSSEGGMYLVNSAKCKIPYIDPMHPSILRFVKKKPPLSCLDEVPLTYVDGNTLFLNISEIEKINVEEFYCCYREFHRNLGARNDNVVEFSADCHQFSWSAHIPHEFIEVKCVDVGTDTEFYTDFHSFVHDKPTVEGRAARAPTSTTPYYYSVLVVGVDSMSRLNMHRQMARTLRYMSRDMGAVEMLGYNKVGDNTFPNLVPLLLGYEERELPQVCYNLTEVEPLDGCNYLWKRYAAEGYRTLYAEDSPSMSTFNYVKEGFHRQPTDYYFRPFIALAERHLAKRPLLNGYACVGHVPEAERVLSWVGRFAAHFRDRPYFAFAWINSPTHDDLNGGSSVDHLYEGFLRRLHRSGALDKTVVVLLGDHGMRWGGIRKTYVGRLEERLPVLLISLPASFRTDFPEETRHLRANARRLTTPFDLHATLAHLLHLGDANWTFANPDGVDPELAHNYSRRATSLLRPVVEDRSCEEAWIDPHWCTCESSSMPLDTGSVVTRKAARFLVKTLNTLLYSKAKHLCAGLKLHSVLDARLWSSKGKDTLLTLIIKTTPGGAVFEATIRTTPEGASTLSGSVSRLNLYGTQSYCVQDAVLKKYCFCV